MEGRAHLFQDTDVKDPDQAYLYKSQPAVQHEDKGNRDIEHGTAAFQGGDADKQAHGPGTRIPHQKPAGRGIVPQIPQYACGEQKDQERKVLPRPQNPVHQVKAHNGNNGQRPRQPVHTVSAVGHVYGGPYQRHDQNAE